MIYNRVHSFVYNILYNIPINIWYFRVLLYKIPYATPYKIDLVLQCVQYNKILPTIKYKVIYYIRYKIIYTIPYSTWYVIVG